MGRLWNNKKVMPWILAASFVMLASVPFLVPHSGLVALFSFVPLFCLADYCRGYQVKRADGLYYATFFLFNAVTTFWIWVITPVGAVFAIAANAFFMWVIFKLFCLSKKVWRGALPYLFFITAWIGWERIYQNIELSWPWLILGNSFAVSPKLVQWYSVTGFLGGSLWILVTSAVAYALLRSVSAEPSVIEKYARRRRLTHIIGLIVLIIAPMVLSLVMYGSYKETSDSVEVVAVQPNIDAYTGKHGGMPQREQDSLLFSLIDSKITSATRYVITPETYTYNFNLDAPCDNATYCAVKGYIAAHPGVEFLLGSLTFRVYKSKANASPVARKLGNGLWYDSFNSALGVGASDKVECYHKSKLVPGVEIIPFYKSLPVLGKIASAFGGALSGYASQDGLTIIHSDNGTGIGVMICYESVYGDYSRKTALLGSQFNAVITNDGWWGDTPGYRQHFRFASLRAIETRRDVVHVANTGITGFIDQRGDVVSRTGWWEPVALRGNVNLNSEKTFFTLHGDIIGRLCCFLFSLLAAALVVAAVTGRKADR